MNLEHQHQKAVMQWANFQIGRYPELGLLFAIPNGGARDPRVGAKLKAEGVKAGVPDLCLPVARGGFNALYLELKQGRNKATPEQLWWHESLRANGNAAFVVHGWESATQHIADYLEGRIVKQS
jgi:hypothetical protein